MAQVRLPGHHDRADLWRRSDRVTLRPGVFVPPAGVTAPRHVAPGRHVVGAPADREARACVRAEAARLHDRRHRTTAASRRLPHDGWRRERGADAVWDHQRRARDQRARAQPVVVEDRGRVDLVRVGQALQRVAALDRHHYPCGGRDDDLHAWQDRGRLEQTGVRPADLADRDVELGRDRGQRLARLHCVVQRRVAGRRRGRNRDRLDDRAVPPEGDVADVTTPVQHHCLGVQRAQAMAQRVGDVAVDGRIAGDGHCYGQEHGMRQIAVKSQ